jgi:hypothetical protein
MSILHRHRPRVKKTRVSDRPAARFGAGLLRSLPAYQEPYSAADLEWAAQAFADGPEPDWDAIYGERELELRYEESVADGSHCAICGLRDDFLLDGVCPPCNLAWEAEVYGAAE